VHAATCIYRIDNKTPKENYAVVALRIEQRYQRLCPIQTEVVHEELLARLPETRAAMFVCKVQCSDGHTCIAYVAAEHVGAAQLQPLHGHTQGDDWVQQTTCCEE